MARIFRKLRNRPGLSEHEKHLFARSLAATPDERWQMHENFLRSYGLFKRSDRKKYGFKVVGMSAAILQGCPATTLDTNLWIDLPARQYMQVLRLCQAIGATISANTVVEFDDGSMVNFLYHVDGLSGFNREYRQARRIKWLGTTVAVLPLARILRSKTIVGRPKDIAHLPLLKETILLTKRRRFKK